MAEQDLWGGTGNDLLTSCLQQGTAGLYRGQTEGNDGGSDVWMISVKAPGNLLRGANEGLMVCRKRQKAPACFGVIATAAMVLLRIERERELCG